MAQDSKAHSVSAFLNQLGEFMENPVTDKELDVFYGKKTTMPTAADHMEKVLTQTIKEVSPAVLAVEYVSYASGLPKIGLYSVKDVFIDYGTEPKPIKAFIDVLQNSDCPLVAAYREAVATRFIDANADELDNFKRDDV